MIALLLLLACDPGPSGKPGDRSTDTGTVATTPTGPTTGTTPAGTTPPTTPRGPETCDAGTAAWVARALPLVWGRRAHGAHEIAIWSQVADAHGRDAALGAMTRSQEYAAWWSLWFADALNVARTGDKEYRSCFARPERETPDGALTAFIRDNPPDAVWEGGPFGMKDVLLDAIVADDVSVIYQAHLFARMNRPVQGGNVSREELEYNRRVDFGEQFLATYLNRNLTCIPCHNSEFSVTGHPDPALDRTWELPGLFESALFGSSVGDPDANLYHSMFRRKGLVKRLGRGGRAPWGMDTACGIWSDPASLGPDFIGQEDSFFIAPHDSSGTVFDLERDLVAGVAALAEGGLTVGTDLAVDGRAGFAYLVGANVVDQVWRTALGQRLTIAHGFPRNQGQQLRLQALTDAFVERRFSLRGLLSDIALDPYFNADLPEACGLPPYAMEPVVDPWTVYEEGDRAGNGPGDLVHRHDARVLLRSAYDALGWGPPPEYRLADRDEALQQGIGVFLRDAEPGFDGTDFQGLLSWEAELGACDRRHNRGDDLDAVSRLVAAADGATVRELVVALKDRLVLDGAVHPDEAPLVEALLGLDLDDTVGPATTVEPQLRLLCGALLASPDAMLAVVPAPVVDVPTLALDVDAECSDAAVWVAAEGLDLDCAAIR